MSNQQEKPWWLRPMTLESLGQLQKTVKEAHEKGLGLACVTMNQVRIALSELQDRMSSDRQFKIGDVVEKVSGYRWPGAVVAVFDTLSGERRVVVECTVPEVKGALHIYNESQLRLFDGVAKETPEGTERVSRAVVPGDEVSGLPRADDR